METRVAVISIIVEDIAAPIQTIRNRKDGSSSRS